MRSPEFCEGSRLLLLPAVLVALLLVPVIHAKSRQARQEPEGQRLITEAEGIARGFSPEERADLLLDMLETPMGDFPAQGKSWSLELFSISKKQLRPGAYRAAIQKNALIHLAKLDPLEAAKLFKTQDTPDMWDQPVLMEDYRTWVARTLFPKLWSQSGVSSLPKIKKLADWLGSTGEYPYVAMIGIVQSVAKLDRNSAEGLVSDAIRFYRTDPPFVNKHREFTPFILGIADQVRSSLVTSAIEAELDALDAEKKKSDGNEIKYTIQASSAQGTVQFNQQAEFVVYRLLPLINRLDPTWAKEVKDKYEVLKYLPATANGSSPRVTGVAVMPDSQASAADIAAAMDEHRLLQISTLMQSDPRQAAEIAASVQEPGRHAVAEAMLIPAYDQLDPKKADDWRTQATAELDHLPAGKTKLKLIIALADAALSEKKFQAALQLFDSAFDLGQTLVIQDLKDNPGKMAYAANGEEELAGVVADFSKYRNVRNDVVEQTRLVHDDVLKAKLLVAAAKGILSQHDIG
jgi:hypothetical protein